MIKLTANVSLVVHFVSAWALAGAVVELVPDQPGPYLGGALIQVDFWISSTEVEARLLKSVRFDFSASSPSLMPDSTFLFDFEAIPSATNAYLAGTNPNLPLPRTAMTLDCFCPLFYLPLLPVEPLHIGSLGVQLPAEPGIYRLDAINANEPDIFLGAEIRALTELQIPLPTWRAFTGEIGGGFHDFEVIPEPSTVSLVLLSLAAVQLKSRRRGRTRRLCTIGLLLICGGTARQ